MAVAEEDMEHWEILLERRVGILKTWEDEKKALERKEKELDRASEVCVDAAEKELC